jgi:hypothetical protein
MLKGRKGTQSCSYRPFISRTLYKKLFIVLEELRKPGYLTSSTIACIPALLIL